MIEHVRQVWSLHGLSMGRRLVALYVASVADERGRCRVESSRVAGATGLSQWRAEGELAALVAGGVLAGRRWEDTGAWSVTVRMEQEVAS